MAKKNVFTETSPLGYRVTLSRNRWREIVRFKHPALKGHHLEVRLCIKAPDAIRASVKDPEVHLYYRTAKRGHLCAVVGGDDPDARFIVTAYFTEDIKKGDELWIK